MPKKIALDYDASELRLVVANCSGSRVQVTNAKLVRLAEGDSVSEKLRSLVNELGLQKTDVLVAIGRGKAELRELQLPPVPEDELPDMVRYQAIRSFASASDRAIVDYLVTGRTPEANTLIAAAVGPPDLEKIKELCQTADLDLKRVALRPLAAASLYLERTRTPEVCVMIDLLADDAELVVARQGKVIFVRTVKLPSSEPQRRRALSSELRRTMVACAQGATPDRIVVWGTQAVHAGDVEVIKETVDCDDVIAVDPFSLVDCQVSSNEMPEHVGRLAPLVGLLASDEAAPETLIDFLNPRERVEAEPDRLRRALLIAAPLVAVFLIGFFIYKRLADWDRRIANATNEVNLLMPFSEAADTSIARTERIDAFLDSDVNWLDEIRRFAEKAPPSDKLIVETLSATADTRGGGGKLQISGAVSEPDVINAMEAALRDANHSVVGKGSQEQKGSGEYRWDFTETIMVTGSDLRNTRYERMAEMFAAAEATPATTDDAGDSETTDTESASASDASQADSESEAQDSEAGSDAPQSDSAEAPTTDEGQTEVTS
ncbi:hypothetical protein FYK55_10645 [Roseiconus nitratireducens]|uniref:Competence protein A n=1 Tax=Roseiconus nitratireducens TaxID=2605748 RepID=A0A5M6DAV8_9BACT|nr:hypothetical protein [Roseiconus nitratireducens]KAA5543656.1 hypothetical protein FYK55_10645 [Roseiconus nitratireducens]